MSGARSAGRNLESQPMNLFFEPLQLSVTDANNAVEFVNAPLNVNSTGSLLALVCKGLDETSSSGIPSQLNLRRINLVF